MVRSSVVRIVTVTAVFMLVFLIVGFASSYRTVKEVERERIETLDVTRGLAKMHALDIEFIEVAAVKDGVYVGEFKGYRWSNSVEVTVADHRITEIRQIQRQVVHSDELVHAMSERVLACQSLDVDMVSYATVSSKTFLKAIEEALRKGL